MSKVIVVFGSTGSQGGAVLRSLQKSGNYAIRAITRNANADKAKKLASLSNVSVHEADLDNVTSLDKVLKGAYGTFFVTDFSAHFDHKEVQLGTNLIDSAIRNNVKHVVFSGLENATSVIGKPVLHFDYKAVIEEYGLKQSAKINFTSIRLSAYYQELVSSLLYKAAPETFILTMPVGDKPMFAINVEDIGGLALDAFNKPEEYKSRIVPTAGDFLKPDEFIQILNKNLAPNKFSYGNFTLEKFMSFGFPGVVDITNMFEYYTTGKMVRDISLTKSINKESLGFNDWVAKNRVQILESLAKKDH